MASSTSPSDDGPPVRDAFLPMTSRRSSRERIELFPDQAANQPGEDSESAAKKEIPPSIPHPLTGYAASIRRNSQQVFAERMHTALVLDWDDTLFPTTWVRDDCKLDCRHNLYQQPYMCAGGRRDTVESFLLKHVVRAQEFLAEAAGVANIFIVTLAKRGWVDMTIRNFLPGLEHSIKHHAPKVIYAQEFAKEEDLSRFITNAGNHPPEEIAAFWTRVKGDAISKELEEFHRKLDASWKNVISLGDSDFERHGTMAAGQDYMRREMEGGSVRQAGPHTAEGVSKDGHLKRLRVKTIKMLDKPTVLELTAELTLLRRWLPHIVQRDAGFDVEIEGTDDDQVLIELNRQVTGATDRSLSWRDLAGMHEA